MQRIEITQRMRVWFLALLVLASGQVFWWLYDQGRASEEATARTLALYTADAQAATEMEDRGISRDFIFTTFPHLALREERIVVDPVAVGTLQDKHRRRINQYRWEGGFFLLVLLGGMWVLRRTIEAEATLRQRQADFVAAVTHELKSPLASLQLAAETMARRRLDEEGRARWLGRMTADIARLGGMIGNILAITRLEQGAIELRPEPVSVGSVVERLVGELAQRAAESDVTFHRDVPASAVVMADPSAVETVLRNVLTNALHACAAEGSAVRVFAVRDGGEVILRVVDDGIGFPSEEAPRLFQRFYRVGNEMKRRTPGSGLGLAICRQYVAQDGGRIEAFSGGPGAGATFTITWPAATETS